MDKAHRDFIIKYGIDYSLDLRQYLVKELTPAQLAANKVYNQHLFAERQSGVKLIMPKSKFDKLVEDAQLGAEMKELHSNSPAVLDAWDKYRMLVELTKNEK